MLLKPSSPLFSVDEKSTLKMMQITMAKHVSGMDLLVGGCGQLLVQL